MRIFIDSAKLDEIEKAYSYGICDGVTTNPSLLKKAVDSLKGMSLKQYINKILLVAKGTPVSLEVTTFKYKDMVAEGKKLFKLFNPIAKNVYIKIPVNPSFDATPNMDGINAIKDLSMVRIPVNCTLIFTPEQALLAAKAGAKFISPFAGRVDDYIRTLNGIPFEKTDYFPAYGWNTGNRILEDNGIISGIDLVKQCVEIIKKYELESEILAASLRNARQVREAALVGADIATLPFNVIDSLLVHYKTQEGMQKFTADIVPEYAKLK